MGQILRPYQIDAENAVYLQWNRGVYRTLVSLFTGLGKTNVAIELAYANALKKGLRCLYLCPAHLVGQTTRRTAATYHEFDGTWKPNGVSAFPALGMEISKLSSPSAQVVIASIPSVIERVPEESRPIHREDFVTTRYNGVRPKHGKTLVSPRIDAMLEYGLFDLIIYDESHHSVAPASIRMIRRLYQIHEQGGVRPPRLVGFTATAWRDDGLGLHNLYETMAIHRGYEFGVEQGYLAPLQLPPIRVHANVEGERGKVMKVENWTEVVSKAWTDKARLSRDQYRPTVAYLPSVEESRQLAEDLRAQGIRAAHIDANESVDWRGAVLPDDGRDAVFDSVYRGETQIICNHAVILEGVDVPPLSCVIWGRNTQNIVLPTQAIGRGLRLFAGNEFLPKKDDCLVLDITGNNINLLSIGTLAGFTLDENGDYVKTDIDEEVVTLDTSLDGKDLRDLNKGQAPTSSGVFYSIAQIVRKTGDDWYHADNGVMTLSVSENLVMVVTPPDYTLRRRLERILERIGKQLEENPNDNRLKDVYNQVHDSIQTFGMYNLWSVNTQGGAPEVVYREEGSLDLVLTYALVLASEKADPVKAFHKRGMSWRKEPPTQAQLDLLKSLMISTTSSGSGTTPTSSLTGLTKGEVSQLISYHKAFTRRVAPSLLLMSRQLNAALKESTKPSP